MNKYDIRLLLILLIISLIFIGISKIPNSKRKEAIVYYDNDEVLKIDLQDTSLRTYTVKGYNGDVVIETKEGMVKVVDEISPKHLCSRQGYIKNSFESIICLPNKVVIKIKDFEEVDTVVSVWN